MSDTAPPAAPAAPARATPLQIAVQVGAAGLLFWLYGVDLLDALRFPSAEAAAFIHPPSVAFNGVAVLATLAASGAAIWGHLKRLPATYRGYRLLPIVAVVVLFADLFVVASTRGPLSAADTAQLTVHEFTRRANAAATSTHVPSRLADLQDLLKELPVPPFFERGKQVPAFTVVLRKGCAGPALERSGEPLGTLIYCVSDDAKAAWVTLVGLASGKRFGEPAIFGRGGEAIVGEVQPAAQPKEEEEEPPPKEDLPMPGSRWDALVDAGVLHDVELNGPTEPSPADDAGADAGN